MSIIDDLFFNKNPYLPLINGKKNLYIELFRKLLNI